jgi:hypothetical protein
VRPDRTGSLQLPAGAQPVPHPGCRQPGAGQWKGGQWVSASLTPGPPWKWVPVPEQPVAAQLAVPLHFGRANPITTRCFLHAQNCYVSTQSDTDIFKGLLLLWNY